MNIIFPIIVLFLNTSGEVKPFTLGQTDTSRGIYLVKNYWHTGIVVEVEKVLLLIPELRDFSKFKYVDIGWGDEEFYQHPDFDPGLAVKALFYPTSSAIRVEGFNIGIERYIEIADMAIRIEVTDLQIQKIAEYISASFYNQKKGVPVLLSSRYGGNIKFYKAEGEYHLFNTCNTWIARGLSQAGLNFNEHIILAEQLFKQIR